jgi:DNA-binding winged helix-turn-helix (wHTH) protein
MTRDAVPVYLSGDLRVCPELGQVMTSAGGQVRLGPINMKVLEALLARPGSVVSRAEIYEAVWRNQAVGEDALTRCISDIRAELRSLSGRDDWIETLPKRGYRWTGEVHRTSLADGDFDVSASPASESTAPGLRARSTRRGALRLAGRGAGYVAGLVAMASVLVFAIDRFSGTRMPVVAVLPVAADPAQRGLAAELDLEVARFFLDLEQIRVLSRSAIESRPSNPFPFFYYEFGAQWLVESDLREMSGRKLLTISIADARTGIVELQVTERIADIDLGPERIPEDVFSSLRRFIELQRAR